MEWSWNNNCGFKVKGSCKIQIQHIASWVKSLSDSNNNTVRTLCVYKLPWLSDIFKRYDLRYGNENENDDYIGPIWAFKCRQGKINFQSKRDLDRYFFNKRDFYPCVVISAPNITIIWFHWQILKGLMYWTSRIHTRFRRLCVVVGYLTF